MRKPFLLVAVMLLCGALAQAQDAPEEPNGEAVIAPNLSVNFTLNSSLSPEQTKLYKEIVKQMLRSIPREVVLGGRAKTLLREHPELDHVKVISYLPKIGDDEILDDPFDRDISYFKVSLRLPNGEEEEQIAEVHGLKGAFFDEQRIIIGGVTPEPVAHPRDGISGKMFADNTTVSSAPTPQIAASAVPAPSAPPSQPAQATVQPAAVAQVPQQQQPVEQAPKPSAPAVAQAKPQPGPSDVAAPAQSVEKPAPEKSEAKPVKVASKAKPKPTPPKREAGVVRIGYVADQTELGVKERQELIRFFNTLRNKNDVVLNIVSSYAPMPLGSTADITANRMQVIKGLMRQQGIDPNRLRFAEIRSPAGRQGQFIELEVAS